MKVKELILELMKIEKDEAMVVIDRDENGWHAIENVTIVDGEDDDQLISINISH